DFDINPDVLPQLTMSVWTRFAAGSNPQDGTFTVLSHLDGDYDRSLAIDPRGGGRGWSAYAGSAQVLGFETVEPGHWVMLTAVYDQAAKTAALYVNDKLVKQSDKAILGMGRKFLMVGQLPGNGDGYDGDVDELRIYNRPFSLADVQALFKATKP
ncbi:MAG: LamG domain-containing protein, partial [Candidatus Sericytochromatia bacterium]